MKKQIGYATRIDIQKYHYCSFTLNALNKQNPDIEISMNYGPSHDKPGIIIVDVWAGIAGSDTKRFLYTEHIPQSEVDLDDYVGVAVKVHESKEFRRALNLVFDEL